MAAKKRDGLLMVYCEVPAKHEEEFNAWYNEEHIPERLSIPGVLSAAHSGEVCHWRASRRAVVQPMPCSDSS